MRLVSYNIHKGIGGRDRRYRIDRIQKVITDLAADVVCLQEVDQNVRRTRHDDQPEQLARAFEGAGALYQLNVPLKAGGYGNLILSRWAIRSSYQLSLRLKWRKPRGAQIAVIDSPEGPFQLVHWHLGLAEKERHWQARHLLDHPHFRESAHLPTLIVGDSNDWRNTLTHHCFARHGFHQVTAPRHRFRTFPAYYPVVSLDKAFARGSFDIHRVHVAHTHLTRRASDHLPLVIDFHLPDDRGRADA